MNDDFNDIVHNSEYKRFYYSVNISLLLPKYYNIEKTTILTFFFLNGFSVQF